MNNVLALQLLSADMSGGVGAVEDGSVDGGQMAAASHVSALTCGGDGDDNSHASLLLCR